MKKMFIHKGRDENLVLKPHEMRRKPLRGLFKETVCRFIESSNNSIFLQPASVNFCHGN